MGHLALIFSKEKISSFEAWIMIFWHNWKVFVKVWYFFQQAIWNNNAYDDDDHNNNNNNNNNVFLYSRIKFFTYLSNSKKSKMQIKNATNSLKKIYSESP